MYIRNCKFCLTKKTLLFRCNGYQKLSSTITVAREFIILGIFKNAENRIYERM